MVTAAAQQEGCINESAGNTILTWSLEGQTHSAKAVIALAYIFVGVYGLTWAPGAWIYASEVFPLKYRAKGVGLAAAGNWAYENLLLFQISATNLILSVSTSPSPFSSPRRSTTSAGKRT